MSQTGKGGGPRVVITLPEVRRREPLRLSLEQMATLLLGGEVELPGGLRLTGRPEREEPWGPSPERLTAAVLRARTSASEAEERETMGEDVSVGVSGVEGQANKTLQQQLGELQASLSRQGEYIAQFRALADRVEALAARLEAVERGYTTESP